MDILLPDHYWIDRHGGIYVTIILLQNDLFNIAARNLTNK